jgi:phospholipase C
LLHECTSVPYLLEAEGVGQPSDGSFWIKFRNRGGAAAVFQARSGDASVNPRTYTVEPRKHLLDWWSLDDSRPHYDLAVYGPNGFYRAFKGSLAAGRAQLTVRADDQVSGDIALTIGNQTRRPVSLTIFDKYESRRTRLVLAPGESAAPGWSLSPSGGWYDLSITADGDPSFLYQLAGHVETGEDTISDPLMGGTL